MKKIIYIIALIAEFIISCSPRIHDIRYNENIGAYEVTTQKDSSRLQHWSTLRNKLDFSKINEKDEADSIVFQYNKGIFRDISKITYVPKNFEIVSKPYLSGKKYFSAIQYFNNQEFERSISEFKNSLRIYDDLKFTSDIEYMIGLCYLGISIPDSTKKYFDTFMKYSESICPKTFNLNYNEIYNFDSLLTIKKLPDDHYSKEFNGPALYERIIPGFVVPSNTAYITIGVTNYNDEVLPYGGARMTLPTSELLKGDIQLMYEGMKYGGIGKINYQLYERCDNRLGVVFNIGFSQLEVKYDDYKTDFTQPFIGFDVGYFPHPKLGLYSGCRIYRYTKNNKFEKKYTDMSYFLWNNNYLYSGIGFFFLDNIGILVEANTNQEFHFGLYMSGARFWFK